jgi:FkbM family methyltransferase
LDVRAFEPQPSLARAAAVSAKMNHFSGVHVYELLLGDKQSEVQFYVPAHGVHASLVARGRSVQVYSRDMTTIDELVADGSIPPPDVIKIDVEGAELLVFRGARRTIESAQPYIIFEADANMGRFGHSLSNLVECLRSDVPYRFMRIREDGALQAVNDNYVTSYDPVGNVIALPPNRPQPDH